MLVRGSRNGRVCVLVLVQNRMVDRGWSVHRSRGGGRALKPCKGARVQGRGGVRVTRDSGRGISNLGSRFLWSYVVVFDQGNMLFHPRLHTLIIG